MQKQKVFFFAARADGGDSMIGVDELKRMADDYVRIYGGSCLADPETPSFVRQMMGKSRDAGLPKAG